jgi:hypothetical protein
MFRCQLCQYVVPAGIASQHVVLEERRKEYPFRSRANVVVRKPKDGKRTKTEYTDDPGGVGHEIVQEAIACPTCAKKRNPP